MVSRGGRSRFQSQPSAPGADPSLPPCALCPSVQVERRRAGLASGWSGFSGYNLMLERRKAVWRRPSGSESGPYHLRDGACGSRQAGSQRLPGTVPPPTHWSTHLGVVASRLRIRKHKAEAPPPPGHLGSWSWSHPSSGAETSALLTDTLCTRVLRHTTHPWVRPGDKKSTERRRQGPGAGVQPLPRPPSGLLGSRGSFPRAQVT